MSAGAGPYPSFQTNVNRRKTKRWVEAKSFSYDGDEWGDDDDDEYDESEPQAPQLTQSGPGGPGGRPYPPHGPQSGPPPGGPRPGDGPPPNRNMGNPNMHHRGRPSFDERRPFPPHQGGFEGPYPTAQRPPFTGPENYRKSPSQDRSMRPRGASQPRPMGLDPHPHAPFMPDTRGNGPYPMRPNERRSESGRRPSPGEIFGRQSPARQSPVPSSSRNSRDSSPGHKFPPRKSSLSQQQAPFESSNLMETPTSAEPSTNTPPDDGNEETAAKPLPFIRPADIYKRVEQERERQRRTSQESSRPSLDSERTRPSSPPPLLPHPSTLDQPDGPEHSLRPKPTLDPVTERKSEYGFDKMLENVPADHPSAKEPRPVEPQSTADPASAITRSQTYASSEYSDRPDPISASSVQSKQSFTPGRSDTAQVPDWRERVEDDQSTPRQTYGFPQNEPKVDLPTNKSQLKHNQSLGYRSLVNKAFDDSEDQVPPTPQSMGDSVPRSNSASTSQISPIISRNSSTVGQAPSSTGLTDAPPTIPEEPSSRPTSSEMAQEFQTEDDPLTPPPVVRPGYRRDTATPSANNSPARRPVSVEANEVPESEFARLSTHTPVHTEPTKEEATSTSTRLEGQQNESSILRSESPTKGKVRDLAGKFNASGRSSPPSSPQKESSRPETTRNESFRPVLPGGWMSYTTNTGTSTPTAETSTTKDNSTLGTILPQSSDLRAMDSPPIATAPKKIRNDGPSGTAFAAAAAAGSALADAFSSAIKQPSETEHPDSSKGANSVPHGQKLFGDAPNNELQPAQTGTAAMSTASSKPPTPPPKDLAESNSPSTTTDYFPTPLLPKKSGQNEFMPIRPQMLPALSTDTSPQDSESDRLRKEILKDLTPRSAKAEASESLRSELGVSPKPRDQVESTLIPEEYNTYWNDISQSPDLSLSNPPTENILAAEQSKDLPPMPQSQEQPKAPRTIKRRFSWESWSDDESVPAVQPLSTPTTREFQQQATSSPAEVIKPDSQNWETPQDLSSRPPTSADDRISISESPAYAPPHEAEPIEHRCSSTPSSPLENLNNMRESEPIDDAILPNDHVPQPISKQAPELPKISQELSSHKPLAFQEIKSLKTSQDRVSAYNNARQQFTQTETGLAGWLQSMGEMFPEHEDIMNNNGRAKQQAFNLGHKASPSRSKFPRIASLGGVVQPSQDNTQTAHPQRDVSDSYGTKLSSHQMQEEGKKLLHSAGKFGGKAGGAAKGLLMKGKNRLRQSGGEKARSKSTQFEYAQNTPHSSSNAAPPMHVASNLDEKSKSTLLHQNSTLTDQHVQQPQLEEIQQVQPSHARQETPRLEVSQSDTPESEELRREVPQLEEPRLLVTDASNKPTRQADEVSAISSHDEANIPSRSISEVTGPRDSRDDTRSAEQTGNGESKTYIPGQGIAKTIFSSGSQPKSSTAEQTTDPESTLRAPQRPKQYSPNRAGPSISPDQDDDSDKRSLPHRYHDSQENRASKKSSSDSYHRENTSVSPPREQDGTQEPEPNRRQRQSYSRPFKEVDVNDHPAFRRSPEDIERRSQVYATEESTDYSQPNSSYQTDPRMQPDIPRSPPGPQEGSVYRIPGPYGQQYRSPRQPARPPQQFSPSHENGYDMSSEVRRSMRFDGFGNPISYNSNGRTRPPSQERPFIPRPDATEYALPGIGPPPPAESPSKSRPRSGFFGRARSRSRPPVMADDASDTVENLFSESTLKKERRSSLFGKRTSRQIVPAQNRFNLDPPRDLQHSSTLPPNFSIEDYPKKSKKLKRASTSEATKKTGFARLSGIFSRSKSTNQHPQHTPPQVDSSGRASYGQSSTHSPPTPPRHSQQTTSSTDKYNPTMNGNTRDTSKRIRQNSLQNSGRFDIDNYRSPPPTSPPNLRIDTTSSKHRPVPSSSTAGMLSQQNAPTRSSPYETASPTATSPYGYGSARGLNSASLSHAIDLHKRSRSPRGGRRNSEEDVDISTDPAYRLGRFESPKERGDVEQDKPWQISFPEERKNKNGSHVRPPRTSSLAASNSQVANTKPRRKPQQVQPAELQGSRVDGDESEEEIVMSSTAYPGQEWIPQSYE